MGILKNVDISELIRIHVFRDKPTPQDKMPYRVVVESLEKDKRVVFDPDALKVLNQKVTENAQRFDDGRDPRVAEYIKEFISKMISELHRNGLVVLENIPDGPEDHYASLRNIKLPKN
jgi:hypothetical protein